MTRFSFKNWFLISLFNPFKTLKKLKRIFVPLECYTYIGKIDSGPIMYKEDGYKISIQSHDVTWKDKFNTPRFEEAPFISIDFFKWNITFYWTLPSHLKKYEDEYWEQALWYLYYYRNVSYGCLVVPDIEKAKESWPWQNLDGTSSWNDCLLIHNKNDL